MNTERSAVLSHSQQVVPSVDGPSSLDELAVAIDAEHDAVLAQLKKGAAHAYRAGGLLATAKQKAGHGNWLSWLSAHSRVSERTAQAYMRLYIYCSMHPAEGAQLLSASFTKAMKSLGVRRAKPASLADLKAPTVEPAESKKQPTLAERADVSSEDLGLIISCLSRESADYEAALAAILRLARALELSL